MRNTHMNFQIPNIHHSKVNRRTHAHTHTHRQTDRQTDRQAESNMPFQLFKVGARGGHSLVSSVPMRDQRIVEHTLNSVIDI